MAFLGLASASACLPGFVQRIGLLDHLPGVVAGVVETVARLVVHLLMSFGHWNADDDRRRAKSSARAT